MKRLVGLLLVALFAVVLPVQQPTASAQPSVFVNPRAAAMASHVVNGKVLSTVSIEVDGMPHRVSEVEVSHTLKGAVSGSILVEIPGGERADGTYVFVSHTPDLVAGASVQLALTDADRGVERAAPVALGREWPVFGVADGTAGAYGLLADGVGQAEAVGDYSLTGSSWPDFAPPVKFKVNPANSGVGSTGTINAVKRAFDTWENDPGSSVDFTYDGTTSKTGINLNDSQNTVSWVSSSAGWLAQANWIANSNREIMGFDIQVNRNYAWSNGATPGRFDIGTVVAHEVGHGIGFNHAPASSELMYFQIVSGAVKGLGAGDKSGARFLYPDPNFGKVTEPGHTVAANSSGDVVKLAIRADGELQISRDLGAGFGGWTTLGAGAWASADAAIEPNGAVHIAAVKQNGLLYTRRWRTNGSWEDWVSHGTGWQPNSTPSIATNGATTFLGAVTASDDLKTSVRQGAWASFESHGAPTWAHVDVDVASDGDLWWVGAKHDGRLYVRKNLGTGWSGFSYQGMATWSSDTAPAIAAAPDAVVFGAVKADGRLYVRRQVAGSWQPFERQGASAWASVDVALNDGGTVWLAAHKSWGRLYTRERVSSGWRGWQTQGADTWSPHADASVTTGASGNALFFATKSSGLAYVRAEQAPGWAEWISQGGAVWAPGS